MYMTTTACATAALGVCAPTSYLFYTKVVRWYTINNISDIRRPYDAVILLKKKSDRCTSCDDLNDRLLNMLELDEPSDEQIRYIHSMYCHPQCAISNYSLTLIWALITWKYPTRVAKLHR